MSESGKRFRRRDCEAMMFLRSSQASGMLRRRRGNPCSPWPLGGAWPRKERVIDTGRWSEIKPEVGRMEEVAVKRARRESEASQRSSLPPDEAGMLQCVKSLAVGCVFLQMSCRL